MKKNSFKKSVVYSLLGLIQKKIRYKLLINLGSEINMITPIYIVKLDLWVHFTDIKV